MTSNMCSSIKVLFVISSMEAGGAERVFATILSHIDQTHIDPHLALVRKTGCNLKILPSTLPIYELGGKRLPQAIWPLWRLLKRLKPDVVISTLFSVNIPMAYMKRLLPFKFRLIMRETLLPTHYQQQLIFPWNNLKFYANAYRQADIIICQDESMKEDLIKLGLPPDNMLILYNSVDIKRIQAQAMAESNPYNLTPYNLVACGRLSIEKGFDLLLEAFSRIHSVRQDISLYILGTGSEEQHLHQMSNNLGISSHVHFLGHKDNPQIYFKHADLFVLPSRREPFSNAVLEALACGTPVMAFDCPGGISKVIQEGVNGWLVHPEDTGQLTERILEVLSHELPDPESVISTVEQFSVENTVHAYEKLITTGSK